MLLLLRLFLLCSWSCNAIGAPHALCRGIVLDLACYLVADRALVLHWTGRSYFQADSFSLLVPLLKQARVHTVECQICGLLELFTAASLCVHAQPSCARRDSIALP